MAKAPIKPDTTEVTGIPPVVALHKVVYGEGEIAPANTMFTPVTQDEYDFLFKAEAVRKPTDSELALAKLTIKSAPAPEAPAEDLIG